MNAVVKTELRTGVLPWRGGAVQPRREASPAASPALLLAPPGGRGRGGVAPLGLPAAHLSAAGFTVGPGVEWSGVL